MEGGESGGREGCGVCGGRAACDFCEKGAEVAEEGEDAKDGAECGTEVGELFCNRYHSYHSGQSLGCLHESGGKLFLTKETRMSSHICTLKHLRYSSECTHQTLDELKRSLCALAERIG